MIRAYQFQDNGGIFAVEVSPDSSTWPDQVIWVDVVAPTTQERQFLEGKFSIEMPTQKEIEEIEISSRYQEDENEIYINTYFINREGDSIKNENMSFILRKDLLFTIHLDDVVHFKNVARHFAGMKSMRTTGFHMFTTLFEVRIDFAADILEHNSRDVASMVRKVRIDPSSITFESIAILDENNMVLRENIADKKRVLYSLLKSELLPQEAYRRIEIMLQDLESLVEFTGYLFERLDNLQATLLGILNTEQNKIIKIFTVMSVTFLPPTLIASIYGMNFDFIPELHWPIGYPLILVAMFVSAIFPIYLFKRKGWLK